MELVALLEKYLAYQLAMEVFVPATVAAVRSDFRGFLRFLQQRREPPTLSSFNTRLLSDHISGSRHLEGSTVKRWGKSFAGFANWALLRDYLTRNPVDGIHVRWATTGRRELMFPDPTEARRFLAAPSSIGLLPEVEQVLRMLLLFGGLRRNEILKLRWRHVQLETHELHIYDTKASRRKGMPDDFDRSVPMSTPLERAILRLQQFSNAGPDQPVLVSRTGLALTKESFYSSFHALRDSLGYGPEFVPHCLRHNLSGSLVSLGATPADIALLLGHRISGDPLQRPSTTDGYIISCIGRVRSFLE